MASEYEAGVDVGGTFTDVVLLEPVSRSIATAKTFTTPRDPCEGILFGLREVCRQAACELGAIRRVVHTTTLVANAVLERQGARTALLTTKGFRDVLELRRELRYDLFEPHLEFPQPLVPRRWRLEVDERTTADGAILRRPGVAAVEQVCAEIARENIESIAIAFLHAYANSENEERVGEIVRRVLPDCAVCTSSEVLNEIREYERTAATTLNAYVQPLVARYLERLKSELRSAGCEAPLFLITSTGGCVSAERATSLPLLLVESGAAAGVTFAARMRELMDRPDFAAFEMGGTTAKVAVVKGGQPTVRSDHEIGRTRRFKAGSGIPVGIGVMDLLEIGAGGGSIAEVNALELIQVGPRSAGADPGPACYGRSGLQPTVTDANVVLGYIGPTTLLGGHAALDLPAATAAVKETVADPLGLTVEDAAAAIYEIVTETMAEALRIRAVESNTDVRTIDLVAFGGAAGMHAVHLARILGIENVIVPVKAGVFSAVGVVAAPLTAESSTSWICSLGAMSDAEAEAIFADLETRALESLSELNAAVDERLRSVEMAYVGQGMELSVSLPENDGSLGMVATLRQAFLDEYERSRGLLLDGFDTKVVTWRVRCRTTGGSMPSWQLTGESEVAAAVREIYVDGAWQLAAVHQRAHLAPHQVVDGPAVIEDIDATTLVPPGATASVQPDASLAITVGRRVG